MKVFFKKHATKRRVIGFCSLVAATSSVFGYHALTQTKTETTYVTAPAHRGLFIASLSGTGQVSSESQIDVKPSVSGAVTEVLVKNGQTVKKGDVLMKLDPHDALRTLRDAGLAVRDADASLASAKLSFAKLQQPASDATILQATDALNQARRDLDKLQHPTDADLASAVSQVNSAEQNAKISSDGKTPQGLRNAYDTAVGTLKSIVPVLGYTLSDADNILAVDNTGANSSFATLLSVLDQSQKTQADMQYILAKSSVQNVKALIDPLALQNEDIQKIDAATLAMQTALDKMAVLMGYVSNALADTLTSSGFSQSSLDGLKSTIQSDRANMISKQATIVALQQTLAQANASALDSGFTLQQAQAALDLLKQGDPRQVLPAQERVKEAQQKLDDLKAGTLPIDIKIAQNSVDQRVSALTQAQVRWSDANQTVADYTVAAPFDGVVAKIAVKPMENASQGTAVATMVAKQQIADITLNEIDAAKVKVGNKVTLTFDAVDGLSISGEVDEVATLGVVTQGVVNYEVKIGFDTQDDRVRPGMSVHTAIVTETKPDVILVPNAAVKTAGGQKYVEILAAASSSASASAPRTGTPRRLTVETGLANDADTEITSGLNGDENVVVQTIAPTSAKPAAASQNSALRIPGLTGGGSGGGAFRGGGGRAGG